MRTEIQVFTSEKFGQLRTSEIDGVIWFCGIDVAKALGYTNPRDAYKRHCKSKGVVKRYTPTDGGRQEMVYLDEGNVYRFLPDCLYEKIGGTGSDKDDPNHNKFVTTNVAIVVIPEAEDAPGFYCPDASVSIMETYTAADGAMWEITFGLNATNTLKAVNFGQYQATSAFTSNSKNYYAVKAKIGGAA
jgi:hypothetical protein